MEEHAAYQCVECGGTFGPEDGYDDGGDGGGSFVCRSCHAMRAAARQSLSAGRAPDYAELQKLAGVVKFFAILGYVLGTLGIALGIIGMLAVADEPLSGTTAREWAVSEQLRNERLIAISAGIVASLGFIFGGAVVHLFSHVALVVRDLGRNVVAAPKRRR
jgi:hypothetical protein